MRAVSAADKLRKEERKISKGQQSCLHPSEGLELWCYHSSWIAGEHLEPSSVADSLGIGHFIALSQTWQCRLTPVACDPLRCIFTFAFC